jgi:D-alanine-D-alanine ligase
MISSVLLFGGNSDERLVSVASSQNLSAQFEFAELWYFHRDGSISVATPEEIRKHEKPFVSEFTPKAPAFAKSLAEALPRLKGKSVFLGFHGTEGEDGQIQELLEKYQIPFTGSGSKSSALCFDKLIAKDVVARAGVKTAEHLVVEASRDPAKALTAFYKKHGRIVVKPVASGSSFGLFIVTSDEIFEKALAGIQSLPYGKFLAEAFVDGRELTVGVWDQPGQEFLSLPPSEVILNKGSSFDYEGKYLGKGSTEVTPAHLEPSQKAEAQELAIRAHKALGCYGYSRTDMILTNEGPIFLETNTLPGMTRASFVPQQLEAAGLKLKDFIQSQLELAGQRAK